MELEHKHDAEKKQKTAFAHPVKERIQRDFAGGFFYAAMQIKEANTKKKVVDLCW